MAEEEPTLTPPPDEESPPAPAQPTMAEELASQPYEPLLPVEKKLIGWSLVLGIVLLGVLWWGIAK
ncbi:hypothetical protein AYO44_08640 [Planctomycetaceae bacterium SCGC AG-212-F19]|nr:hypothetical protein AYO44_08640 [Planctomycetaceae bacterium SCGC AG-212-F19]